MAAVNSSTPLTLFSLPKFTSSKLSQTRVRFRVRVSTGQCCRPIKPSFGKFESLGKRGLTRLNAAGFAEIEPDLNEDPTDPWEINSVRMEDFKYGEYDGHHTYHEGEVKRKTFWEALQEDIGDIGAPTGFQGLISWLFPPAVAAGLYFHAPGEYLYIGAFLFTLVFCIIEMDKPDQPHNFEPQIYNMERGARDKLIAEYNTMDIWDFNEKYGDLWDFTVKPKDDITKR